MNNWCGHKKTLIGTERCPLKHNFREAVIDDVIAPDDQLVWCKRLCPTGATNCEEHEIYCLYLQFNRRNPEKVKEFQELIKQGDSLYDHYEKTQADLR